MELTSSDLEAWDIEFIIPYVVSICVKIAHLPLHCWSNEVFVAIGNSLGQYIDKFEPKYLMFLCAHICVEVDLDKGLPKVVTLLMDNWNCEKKVDYVQLPFN